MQFSTAVLSLAASAAVAKAASVTFWSLDETSRTLYFTGNAAVDPVTIAGGEKKKVDLPDTFNGNFYAVPEGSNNVPGMLGEIMFAGWNGLTYFDVSAIVDPNDMSNVKQMWPASGETPTSGCHTFPCDNAYYHPDDVQTKTTTEVDLMCTLGNGNTGLKFLEE